MEVHHPHHPTHKKKWIEYLAEFFMLFLAVFLGFLVENYRENKIEKHRTENHMETMVENLKYDTIRYDINLIGNIKIGKGLDSFRYQIMQAIDGKVEANKLYYYYMKYARDFNIPATNNSAISQLKSAGLLRMVKNKDLLAEIGDYYERRLTTLDRDMVKENVNKLMETAQLCFSFDVIDELIRRDSTWSNNDAIEEKIYNRILNSNPSPALLPSAPQNFRLLYNRVATFELSLRQFDSFIRYCHVGADSLMKHIKEEYHFD